MGYVVLGTTDFASQIFFQKHDPPSKKKNNENCLIFQKTFQKLPKKLKRFGEHS